MKLNYRPDGEIQIICTLAELIRHDSCGLSLYATPSNSGRISGLYWDFHPSFAEDRVVATPQTFAEAKGWTSLGWQDMSADEIAAVSDEHLAITIPLDIPHPHAE